MNKQQEQLEAIKEMRNLMERSSRFLSLSGLAGVVIGIIALLGVAALHQQLNLSALGTDFQEKLALVTVSVDDQNFIFLISTALLVLTAALIAGVLMSANR